MSEIKYDENSQKYKIFDDDRIRDLSDDERMSFCFYLEINRNCEIYDVECPYYPRCEKCKDYEYYLKNMD